jgi:phenylacetate-CoA ligase
VEELKSERLKKIVKYAYENVPFYRKIWKKAGVSTNDIKSEEDLKNYL